MGGCISNEIGILDDFAVGKSAAVLLGDQLGEADNGVEGCAKLMAHVGDELGLDPAGELCLNSGGVLG